MTVDVIEPEPKPGPGADIRGTSLYKAKLPGVDLSRIVADGVNAIGATLASAKLPDAALRGTLLCHCDLTGIDFTNADLTDANLHGSDLTGAKWANAILDRVCWHECVAIPKEADNFEPWKPTVVEQPEPKPKPKPIVR